MLERVRTKAAEWNIDRKRIAAAGGSAGACSSLWLAYHDDLADPDSENAAMQPDYAKNDTRSLRPEIGIYVGICTHLGCSPTFRPEIAPEDLGPDWRGGFYCPCHGSKFDLSGRVFAGVPAPTNLEVPPYRFADDMTLIIGEDSEVAA